MEGGEGVSYLIDGTEVEVVERISSGVVVRRIWDHGEDYDTGDPEIVPQVFEEPPTERKAEAINVLERQEEELRARIVDLQREVRERENARKRLQKLSNESQALARIEDIISGRITHYLVREAYSPMKIVEAANGGIPYVEDHYGRKREDGTKLLVLFGNSDGNLQWKANQYRDGSGSSWTDVEPFTSRDAALIRMQVIVNAFEDEKEYYWESLYHAAVKYGLQVPETLHAFVANSKITAARAALADAQEKAKQAQDNMEGAIAKWGSQSGSRA